MEFHSKGKLGDKDVSFTYIARSDHNNGSLEIFSERFQIIWDKDVIAVVQDANADCHRVFHVASANLLTPALPGNTSKVEILQAQNLPKEYIKFHFLPTKPSSLFISPYRDGTPNLHVIVSTNAGTGGAQAFFDGVLKEILRLMGLTEDSYMLHVTKSEKSVADLTHGILSPRANEGFVQTIILLSGDGGVVDIVNALLSSPQSESYVKPVIGLLSLGTGNALATSTDLMQGYDRGLRALLCGKPHSLPTFTASFSPGSTFLVDEGTKTEPLPLSEKGFGVVHGAVVCSWALHASLVADSDTTAYRKHGNERFAMAAQELLSPSDGSASHVYHGKITTFINNTEGSEAGHVLPRQEHMYVLTSLVSNLETSFCISPQSKPFDGQLRLLHFGTIPSAEVTRLMGLANTGGRHVDEEQVAYEPVDGFRIDFKENDERWRRVCVDGKIVKVDEGGWVEVRMNSRHVVDIIVNSAT